MRTQVPSTKPWAKNGFETMFQCDDCLVEITSKNGDYVLHDALWAIVAPCPDGKGMLCYACLEKRLGRPLRLADLKPCPLTHSMFFGAMLARREDVEWWECPRCHRHSNSIPCYFCGEQKPGRVV